MSYHIQVKNKYGQQLLKHRYPDLNAAMRDWDNVLDSLEPNNQTAFLLREDGSVASQYSPMKHRGDYGLKV